MEMRAAVTVTDVDKMEVAVSVRTVRTAATSLASRDWMCPVFVAVKNASSIVCRCANRRIRRSAMAELPTVAVSQFWPMPMRAATTGMTHIAATSQPRMSRRGWPVAGKSASSKTALVRNGISDVSKAAVTTAIITSTILPRYGWSSRPTRRSTGPVSPT